MGIHYDYKSTKSAKLMEKQAKREKKLAERKAKRLAKEGIKKDNDKDKVFKATLIITVLGIINVPIIKYSVDWWNTLHQPASINIFTKSSIDISMLFPLIIMTAAFALFSLLIFLMKYNTELIKIKNKGLDRL